MWEGFQAYLPTMYLQTVKEGFKIIARTRNLHNLNQYLLRILHILNNSLVDIFLWCPIITWFFFSSIYNTPAEILYIVFLNAISIMLQHVQFRNVLQIRKINVTDTICTMKTVHRVIHLWHLSVMRNDLIVRILCVTREKCRIGVQGKRERDWGE